MPISSGMVLLHHCPGLTVEIYVCCCQILACYVLCYTHTHTTILLLFWNMSGTTRVSRYQKGKTRKVKTNLDLLEQEIVSGSGICWDICKSAPHPRQLRQHPTTQCFTGRMPFLPPNQQHQSTATHTHTTHNRFTALWNLLGTTRVSRYQKKHSPTNTHSGHQSSQSAFSIYYEPWHPSYSIHVLWWCYQYT